MPTAGRLDRHRGLDLGDTGRKLASNVRPLD
jgi:hypothetical protein